MLRASILTLLSLTLSVHAADAQQAGTAAAAGSQESRQSAIHFPSGIGSLQLFMQHQGPVAKRTGAPVAARGGAPVAARGGAPVAARGGAPVAARGGAPVAARGGAP